MRPPPRRLGAAMEADYGAIAPTEDGYAEASSSEQTPCLVVKKIGEAGGGAAHEIVPEIIPEIHHCLDVSSRANVTTVKLPLYYKKYKEHCQVFGRKCPPRNETNV